jgi:hypothetical protein
MSSAPKGRVVEPHVKINNLLDAIKEQNRDYFAKNINAFLKKRVP